MSSNSNGSSRSSSRRSSSATIAIATHTSAFFEHY